MCKRTWLVLCLMSFISGCGTTDTIVVQKTIAAIPPRYLWDSEAAPSVQDGLPESERTQALFNAYAQRGDAIARDQRQELLMQQWVEGIQKIYPGSVAQPLEKFKAPPAKPQKPTAQ